MTTRLAVFDGNNIVLGSSIRGQELTTSDGRDSGGLYMSITRFSALLREIRPSHVLWVFDYGRSKKRLEMDPNYKGDRPPTKEKVSERLEAFREFLDVTNYAYVYYPGVEADDLMASAVGHYKDLVDEIFLVTGDHDLHQLVDDQVTVYRPSRGKNQAKVFTPASVLAEYDLPSSKLAELWALTGDAGDNIPPAYRGMGPVTAMKELRKHNLSLPDVLNNSEKIQAKEGSAKRALLNFEMIRLVPNKDYELPPLYELAQHKSRDSRAVLEFFDGWEFAGLRQRFLGGTLC